MVRRGGGKQSGVAGQQWVEGGGALTQRGQCAKRTLKHSCLAWHNTTLTRKKRKKELERERERGGGHNAIVLQCIPIGKAMGEKQ